MGSTPALFSALLFGTTVYLFCRLATRPLPSYRWLLAGVVYLLLALTTAPALWRGLAQGYKGDSFHTLSEPGQVGLLLLSLVLAVALIGLAAAKTWHLYRVAGAWSFPRFPGFVLLDGLANLLLFWLFLWLSPQLYYAYYLVLFDDIAWQWVVKPPPGLGVVLDLLAMARSGSLSDHGLGLLGRAVLLLSLTAPALRAAAFLTRHRGPMEAATLPRFAFTLAAFGALFQTILAAVLAAF